MRYENVCCRLVLAAFSVLSAGAVKAAEYWTDRYDVEWTSPSDNGPMDSMPFGGGDVGCNIWVEKGDVLLYVQKSGSFNELGEYVKLGRFRLTFTPNPFEESAAFSQKLRLQDGSVTITARGKKSTCDFKLELKCWADVLTGSIHLVVESTRPVAYRVRYETWRHRDRLLEETARVQKMGDSSRFGSYSFVGYPGEVKKLKDEFRYDGSTILFYHRNPESPMAPNVGIEQQDLAAYKDQLYDGNKNLTFGGKIIGSHAIKSEGGDGNYRGIDFKYLALESKGTSAKHHIMIATHRARDAVFANWKKRLDDRCGQVQRTRGNVVKNRRWWRNFWDRSRVVVKPKDRDATDPVWKLGLYYQLGRYQFGCNYYGDSPTKFNGGSFTVDPFGKPFDPDWRCWGGDFHRAQNQRLIYWPMLKMGDAGAMRAQFNLYRRGLPGATIRVKKYFGHEGALYAENTDATGLAFPLAWCWPPNGFSAEKRIRPQEVPFGDARITGFTKGLVERGMMYSASIGYHFTSQLEHAYMILEFHRFTGGSIEKYLPFIKQSVIFFDQHYQKRQMLRNGKPFDERGKLYIYPAMACETGNMPNPADVVAGLEACLEGLIALESALVTNEEKDYYRAFLDRLPPTPFLREHGGHTMLASGEGNNRTGGTRELPQFYPLFPFNRITPADKEEMEIARETWRHDTTIDLNSIYGWQQKNIFAARVGLPGDAMALNVKKMNNANKKMRFPSFFGPAYDGMPDHNWIGAGMIGIQEMLLQTFGDKIYVLPAWPVDVDVDFKLHAPQQTVVEVSFRDGEIRRLDVTPEEREKDVIVVPEL